ncbi:MAG TPA: hypothetical protein VFL72_06405, partial [Acidimicrobiia bacterium]|nr:hypothetical protein [Acidimicrobiia bacterium]
MANWHPSAVAAVSWLFPFVAGGIGFYAASQATTDPFGLAVAVTFLVIGSLVGVATSNSGNRFTTGLAVAAAIPFVLTQETGGVDLAGSIATYGIGLAIVWAFGLARGEKHTELLPTQTRRFAGYATYATVYSAMRVGPFEDVSGEWLDLVPFGVA